MTKRTDQVATAEGGVQPSGETMGELVDQYIGLVRTIAHDIRRRYRLSIELDELVSAGVEGLLEAAKAFDGDGRAGFSVFAHYRIRGAIIDNCRRLGVMRRIYKKRLGFEAAANEVLTEQAAVLPNKRSLEGDTNWLAQTLDGLVTAHAITTDPEALRKQSPEHQVDSMRWRARLRAGLAKIDGRERVILVRHYIECESLADIAEDLGFSRSWASRLHARALEKLRPLVLERPPPTGGDPQERKKCFDDVR